MGIVTFTSSGSFKRTMSFLNKVSDSKYLMNKLDSFGKMGVEALSSATPVDTGKTAQSWTYTKTVSDGRIVLTWNNTNVVHYVNVRGNGRKVSHYANIAVIVDTGHATGTGGYVAGRHYIEPAIRPVFDRIAKDLWKEVTSS